MKKLVSLFLCIVLLYTGFAYASESTLIDNSQVTFRVKSFTIDQLWGLTMNVYLENKTDKTAMFSLDNCVVDGYVNDPFGAKELMPNSKANVAIQWNSTSQIPTLISFSLRVYDSNDWLSDDIYSGQHTIYPQGEEAIQITDYQAQYHDIILIDNNQIAIYFLDTYVDPIWGYTANLYLHNKTNKNLMFSVDNAALNGYTIDPFWACAIPANARSFEDINWMHSDLKLNDITSVHQLVLSLRVYDADDWFADDYYNQTIEINNLSDQ